MLKCTYLNCPDDAVKIFAGYSFCEQHSNADAFCETYSRVMEGLTVEQAERFVHALGFTLEQEDIG